MTLESRRRGMNGTDTNVINRKPWHGFAWVGKAALLCLGLLAMLTLVVVMVVLTAVMLTAAILPATAEKPKRVRRGRQASGDASTAAATRKAVVS